MRCKDNYRDDVRFPPVMTPQQCLYEETYENLICPVCGSNNVSQSPVIQDVDTKRVELSRVCENCGSDWLNTYKLIEGPTIVIKRDGVESSFWVWDDEECEWKIEGDVKLILTAKQLKRATEIYRSIK